MTTVEELLGKSPCFLRSIGLSSEEIELAESVLTRNLFQGFSTALELSETAKYQSRLKLKCESIDAIINGGFSIRGINEIYGPSGSGKTQFCIQLSLQAQLPAAAGGLGKNVAFLCTEDAFQLKRLAQIGNQYATRYPNVDFLNNIFIDHVGDNDQLMDCIRKRLSRLLATKPIGLLVIDSIAGIFRIESNLLERAVQMRIFAKEILELQNKHDFVILCTNQVSFCGFCKIDSFPLNVF